MSVNKGENQLIDKLWNVISRLRSDMNRMKYGNPSTASGTVTSLTQATGSGAGIILTPNPLTTSGTIGIDNTIVVTLNDTQTLVNKTLTSPRINQIFDTLGNTEHVFTATASSVNYITWTNGTAGNANQMIMTGTDTDISLNIVLKGAGRLQANGVTVPTISSTDTLTNKTLTTPTIGSFTNATHNHLNAAGGGTLDAAAIASGTFAAARLPTATKRRTMAQRARTAAATAAAFANASSSIVSLYVQIPDDYVSGDITLKMLHRGTGSTGNWRMQSDSYRFRDATAFLQMDNAVLSTVASTTNSKLFSSTAVAANFQAGDVIRWDITRLGADAADTSTQDSEFDGAWIEYLGYQ